MDRDVAMAPNLGAAKPISKAATGIAGFDDLTLVACRRGGRRWSAAALVAARRSSP